MIEEVVKRDGTVQKYDWHKIVNAINKTVIAVDGRLNDKNKELAYCVVDMIHRQFKNKNIKQISIEEIQDIVEHELMITRSDVAKAYILYRFQRALRRSATFDKTILEIVSTKNEYWNSENSNKNPRLNTTIRDYIAGAVNSNLSRRMILPKDVIEAHDEGIIHFHDLDYSLQKMTNCCLINIEDMLQNGTVISETFIEKPHSFSTACNVATQIIAQVASSQYGGQSVSLAHLAPFVDASRQNIKKEVIEEHRRIGRRILEDDINDIVFMRLKKEIAKGIQILQYQITTLMTTNGQAPFITLFMYLNEAKSQQEKDDLAMLIEEVLKQSLQGVKNEVGVWVTPAFPKIIYVLQDDNITEDSKYWYLTKLAAKCSLKRLTPDYISEKKMKELKEGYCFPVMG